MIENWLDIEEAEYGELKRLFVLSEINGGRVAVQADLIERVRAHYDDPRHIADDIAELGFPGAAAILRERLPTNLKTRSGEVGEILATEFMEHQTGFRIPVRRLRYKDGREMALRGDDFLGIEQGGERLRYLKGEAKSGRTMSAGVITTARTRLNDDEGRPTPISLLFVADRLLEGGAEDEALGRQIRNAVGRGTIRARDVTHGLFTLTGNDRRADLEADLVGADDTHSHVSVNLRINDHRAFIAWVYEEAENLGND
ncbi:Hachiman antiphage defense system protein HamA [Amaricoccus solimangrovi]|uniref:DUF1837 domain-containing protein n=1 Tax=Amaricoccus solimangrovi TaxID=2589815 RepID=A0A501WCI2_9RHOB|nr:Hachiman antiphage defense system protein HamA [Amaricoccus solimangrovi]TPE46532.1 DUF1837 domain-containing protein [Amaricoccus solimangrovi]